MASLPHADLRSVVALTGRGLSPRARIEHRLRQIDRLLMQEALTPSALHALDSEKRALLAELEAPMAISQAG